MPLTLRISAMSHHGYALLASIALLLAAGTAATTSPAGAASSNVTVTFSVLSATSIDTASCGGNSSSAGLLSFGTVQAGSPARSGNCAVQFGSTNDTASLRVRQVDATPTALFGSWTGTLDPGFGGGDGLRTYDISSGYDQSFGAALQTDGKLVMGGSGGASAAQLLRVTTDGNLDPTFDGPSGTGNGRFALDFGAGTELAYRIESTPRGLIVPIRTPSADTVTVLRLDDTGAYDPTWGASGTATVQVQAGRITHVNAVKALTSGGVVVGGCVADASNCSGNGDLFLIRLDASGRPDPSFGTGGVVVLNLGSGYDLAGMVDVQADGRIVVGATRGSNLWVGRFNVDGSLDTAGFNSPTGSIQLDHLGGAENGNIVAVRPDGKILAGGEVQVGGQNRYGIFRLHANGTLDTTFGVSGVFEHQPAGSTDSGGEDIFLLPDGKFLLTGRYNGSFGASTKVPLLRVNENGTIDTTFGTAGITAESEQAGGVGYDIVDFPDGRLAVAGRGNADMQVAVFAAAPSIPDYAPGTNDFATAGSGLFGICIQGVAGGTTTWSSNPTCPLSDGHWRAVPTSTAGAVAASTAGPGTATATFAFGVRPPAGTAPGSYRAPIRFEVIAPA